MDGRECVCNLERKEGEGEAGRDTDIGEIVRLDERHRLEQSAGVEKKDGG